jgi:hypothetical protein
MACSCRRVGIFKGQKQSEIVFKGTVVNIVELPTTEVYGSEPNEKIDYLMFEFEFEIHSIYKGKKEFKNIDTIKIRTTGGGADCGNWFEKGTSHLVYSYSTDMLPRDGTKTDEYLTTSLCTRTKKANFFSFFEIIVLTIF